MDAIFDYYPDGEKVPREAWLVYNCLADEFRARFSDAEARQSRSFFAAKVARYGGTVGKLNPPDGKFFNQYTTKDFEIVGW